MVFEGTAHQYGTDVCTDTLIPAPLLTTPTP